MALQTKDTIRQRMLKTASENWGVQPQELESFDPIVRMIFGACAVEMERMYNDMEVSRGRVLERLAKLLMPEVNKGPQPAHAVLHASPSDLTGVVNSVNQFYFTKKIAVKESSVKESLTDLYFTAIADYKLFKAEVKYLAYGDTLDVIAGRFMDRNKAFVPAIASKQLTTNDLWVGLKVDDELEHADDIMFYFDWVNVSDIRLLLNYLPFTKWYCGKSEINCKLGYAGAELKDEDLDVQFEFDVQKKIFRSIHSYYRPHFVTLPSFPLKNAGPDVFAVPEIFKDVFDPKGISKLEKVVWLKIAFPSFITHNEFDNLTLAVNCFPVANRNLHDFYYKIQNNFNIIPLNTDENEFFFSIQSVKSGEGKDFTNSSIKDWSKLTTGLYIVRKGGVERFDSRNATEYLKSLDGLMRDESASFQVYGQEIVAENIRQLSQILNQIAARIEKSGNKKAEGVHYLVLKPENSNENVFVEFWSTTGSFANGIKIGSNLTSYSGSEVKGDSLIFMNTTSGGKDSLSDAELLSSFRQALISRDRVVTETDIRYFCLNELGAKVADVEVKKGLQLDSSSKSGFVKTLEIIVKPAEKTTYSDEEWNFICRDLSAKLNSRMSTFMPVRVVQKK